MQSPSSMQCSDFKQTTGGAGLIDGLGKRLSSLSNLSLTTVEEGLRGMEDTKTIKSMRNQFDATIDKINTGYADEVLETGRLLDEFNKKVSTQQQVLVDALRDYSWRGNDIELKSLTARKNDSATFERLGTSRYFVFAIIAIVVLSFTFTNASLDFSAYWLVSVILASVLIFILTYFYGK